jgi:hypothetical protein
MAFKPPFQRFREQNGLVKVACDYFQRDTNCTTPLVHPAGWPQLLATSGFYRSISDVVTPGYKFLSAKGNMIVNPFTYFEKRLTVDGNYSSVRAVGNSCNSPVMHWGEDVTGPYALYGSTGNTELSPKNLIAQSDIDNAIKVASTAAWRDAAAHDADILTDIAEIGQTIRMIRDPLSAVRGLTSAINSTKRSTSAKFGAAGQTARDLWLQYRYGIRPAVKSVNGIIEAMTKQRGKRRQTYRGKYNLFKNDSVASVGGNWSTQFPILDNSSDEVIIRAGILMEEAVEISTSLGLDASGMLAVPWEIVPFSFVADWFINVGDFLQSLQPYLTKHPLATWYTLTRTQTRIWKISGPASATAGWSIERQPSGVFTGVWKTKTRITPLGGLSLTFKPQALRKVMNDLRLLDSLALACQQLGKAIKG